MFDRFKSCELLVSEAIPADEDDVGVSAVFLRLDIRVLTGDGLRFEVGVVDDDGVVFGGRPAGEGDGRRASGVLRLEDLPVSLVSSDLSAEGRLVGVGFATSTDTRGKIRGNCGWCSGTFAHSPVKSRSSNTIEI